MSFFIAKLQKECRGAVTFSSDVQQVHDHVKPIVRSFMHDQFVVQRHTIHDAAVQVQLALSRV